MRNRCNWVQTWKWSPIYRVIQNLMDTKQRLEKVSIFNNRKKAIYLYLMRVVLIDKRQYTTWRCTSKVIYRNVDKLRDLITRAWRPISMLNRQRSLTSTCAKQTIVSFNTSIHRNLLQMLKFHVKLDIFSDCIFQWNQTKWLPRQNAWCCVAACSALFHMYLIPLALVSFEAKHSAISQWIWNNYM